MRSKLLSTVLIAGCSVLVAGCGGSSSGSSSGGSSATMTDTAAAGSSTAASTAMAGSTTSAMGMGGDHPCSGYGSTKIGSYDVLVAIEDHAPILSMQEAEASTDAETHILVAGTGVENSEAANKHVEVHICDGTTGAPAQHLTPTVTIKDLTGGGDAAPLAVAEVYGKGEDPANVHYGNNVAFPPGHQAEVKVTVDGQTGTFKVAVE